MYTWLEQELNNIKQPDFHQTGIDELVESSVMLKGYNFPYSYTKFHEVFSGVRLFRKRGHYRIIVFAQPKVVMLDQKKVVYIGFTEIGEHAYFRGEDLLSKDNKNVYVYEKDHDFIDEGLENSTLTFADWLKARYDAERSSHSATEWNAITDGTIDFNDKEKKIIEARKHFHWEVIGRSDDGNFIFKITNLSSITLPYISIGMRSRDRSLNSKLWIPVSDLEPSCTKIIEKEVYGASINPNLLEVYELPEPNPLDKEKYWEFRIQENSD